MEPDLVIYHGNCYDGFTAAWLLHREFPEAEFFPATYGDGICPKVEGKHVLMVDFSYPREDLIDMNEQAEELIVLDHHKTAEESLRGLDFCEFDMERAGCQMAWDWLYTKQDAPRRHWLVEHVADRDLWKLELPQTPAIHAYYTSVPMTFDGWQKMSQMGRDVVVKLGKAIRQSIDRYCEKVGAEALRIGTPWGETLIVNAPYLNASELADYLLKTTEYDWTVAWFLRGDGKFQYSLRSRGEFDVSAIARTYGGGGHLNAAGFDSLMAPWVLWPVDRTEN